VAKAKAKRARATPTPRGRPRSKVCPSGHKLPHRTKAGRCSLRDCVDQQDSAKYVADIPDETPDIKALPVMERLRKRAEQAAPAALEKKIQALKDGSDAAASDILDRIGFSRNPEQGLDFRGSVVVLKWDPNQLPWKQEQEKEISGRLVEGSHQQAGGGATSAGDAEAGSAHVEEREVEMSEVWPTDDNGSVEVHDLQPTGTRDSVVQSRKRGGVWKKSRKA
jgi:hypothetical protein